MQRSTLRLFFALWPEPGTKAALARIAELVARETGGRGVAADNIHLTLAFLGEQPDELVGALCALAAGIERAPFALLLDDIGYWRKAGLAWLGADAQCLELSDLQRDLAQRLAGAGIALEPRPFAPHITLARRIATIVRRRLAPPIVWNVDSFSLVESKLGRQGARYGLLETWPLRAGAR